MSHRQWLQEYECEFLGTGDTYVDGEILKQLKERTSPDYWIKYNNRMRVWAEPDPGKEYLMGVDVSLGRERDFSAFHIFDLTNGHQVAEFYSNKTPINEFARIVNDEGRYYNLAYVFPERNTIGNNLIDRLIDEPLEYDNIHMDDKGVFGVQVTTKNREEILADMEELLRTNSVKINSERTVDELLTFIVNDVGKAEAEEGYYDDLVMSLSIAAYGIKELIGNTPLEHYISNEHNGPILPGVASKFPVKESKGVTHEEYVKWMLGKSNE